MTKIQWKLWVSLLVMALFTPLGILLPAKFKAGEAWGEWGTNSLAKLIGYVPKELMRFADVWQAPIPDYDLAGDTASHSLQAVSYITSGFIGMLAVGLLTYLILWLMGKNEK